jgi:hypothetical protein
VFGVDEGGGAAGLLNLGHGVQGQGRLARGFRAEHLDHPPARQAADAQRHVQAQRAGRDALDLGGHPALPSFITEPLPKARSICAIAASRARCLSPSSLPTSFKAACAIAFVSLAMIPVI